MFWENFGKKLTGWPFESAWRAARGSKKKLARRAMGWKGLKWPRNSAKYIRSLNRRDG